MLFKLFKSNTYRLGTCDDLYRNKSFKNQTSAILQLNTHRFAFKPVSILWLFEK